MAGWVAVVLGVMWAGLRFSGTWAQTINPLLPLKKHNPCFFSWPIRGCVPLDKIEAV